jgi:hypothetical protein
MEQAASTGKRIAKLGLSEDHILRADKALRAYLHALEGIALEMENV